ncbi:hypothetical protein ACFFRS_19930, partial [Saccharopolyspora hordei]|uniref:hypothetical protein n=1 Tax=Saccharopolyspora hordei TaxID=1838 RepID=UPI0035E916D1
MAAAPLGVRATAPSSEQRWFSLTTGIPSSSSSSSSSEVLVGAVVGRGWSWSGRGRGGGGGASGGRGVVEAVVGGAVGTGVRLVVLGVDVAGRGLVVGLVGAVVVGGATV